MTHMLLLGKANNNKRSLWKLKQPNSLFDFGNCAEELIGLTCLFFFFLSCIFCSVWTNIALVCGETKGDPKRKTMGAPYNDKPQLKKAGKYDIADKQHIQVKNKDKEKYILTRCTQEGQQVSLTQLLGTWVMTCKLSLEKELKMLFFVNIHCLLIMFLRHKININVKVNWSEQMC